VDKWDEVDNRDPVTVVNEFIDILKEQCTLEMHRNTLEGMKIK